ncbi:MAG: dynamin family protein [Acidobacteria bacterium]|nr:dynamin family protein [Acidobacteriota bacterium]
MLPGLTENHERSLLASVQYAAKLIRDCDDVLTGAAGSDPLSRYATALSTPQEKIARDYLRRLREQLLRALKVVGLAPPAPFIGAVHALNTALMFLDDTFEEMRGRHLSGYGQVPAEAERVLDGVVSELQELTRDFGTFLTGVSDDVLRQHLERLAPTNPVANDLRELSRIIGDHGLIDLRPALALLVDRALEETFDVAVIGRVSSGKSSLLNALLGAPILPTGVLPVTAFPTRLRRGPEARLHIAYANGRTDTAPVDRIADFVAESGNPGNEKRLTRLLLVYPSARLPMDVTFVDTPGLGSVTPGGALQTYAYLPRCDHATFLFEATAPVGEEDLAVLAFLHEAGITTSVLLSKSDLLAAGDLERVRQYVAEQVRKRLGAAAPVRAMSTMPTHESLLGEWIRDEVTPLGGQAQHRAREALGRKIAVLRQQAIGALEHHATGSRSSHDPDVMTSIAARVRDMSATLERTSRDLLSLQDRKATIVEAALTAAAQTFTAGEPLGPTAAAALRADLVRSSQDVGATVARELEELAREVEAVLTDAANAAGAPVPIFEPLGLHRETPLLDVPPLSLEPKAPVWARVNRRLFRRWIAERVRDEWQAPVERAVDAYLDVLRRWATDGLARLRREFEGQSRPLLMQFIGASTTSATNASTTTAVQRDLEWLRRNRVEMTHVQDLPDPCA